MRYGGDLISNIAAAHKSKDMNLLRDIIIDQMAVVINNNPYDMVKLLADSGISINNNTSKKKLADVSVQALHNSPKFQNKLAIFLVNAKSNGKQTHSLAEGDGGGGGGGGEVAATIVGSVADMIGSISKWGASKNDLKAQENISKSKLFDRILNKENKINWMPIVVISGVLLIGAIVVWRATATK